MRTLERNKTGFYYCLFQGAADSILDENENRTGTKVPIYAAPVYMKANVSPATGYTQKEQFGDLTDYDHVIVTDQVDCPITESTVLFLEKAPEFSEETFLILIEKRTLLGDNDSYSESYSIPLYDYIVRRVSRSLNSVSIAVSKVKVS